MSKGHTAVCAQVRKLTIRKQDSGNFTLVHNRFLDEYMIRANGEFVKVYLYLLRCCTTGTDVSLSSIADAFNYTENDVKRALGYWEGLELLHVSYGADGSLADIVLLDGAPEKPQNRLESYTSRIAEQSELSNRRIFMSADRKKELAAQEDVRQLLYIAEQYLGKKLSSTEVTNILYYYDELHFSSDLIEYLIEYCVSKGKKNVNYIRAVALEWASRGITTVEEARRDTNLYNRDFYAVLNAFGLKDRSPGQAEAETMTRWFSEYGFSLDIVLEACRRTLLRTHEPNFPYANRILQSWYESGVRRLCDIEALDKPAAPQGQGQGQASAQNRFNNFPQRAYDFDALEKTLLDE